MAEERFVGLDAARGVGAVSVVLWHWSHFLEHGSAPGGLDPAARPLFGPLYWFYSYGWMGVDFFFVLSGFIFFWFYRIPVARRQITAWEFVRRRFARLYPLYGATLVLVIVLQYWYFQTHGDTFVYPAGNASDLLQAITLTSHWWPNQGWFFNGPGWSISVECFLYLVFFLAARYSADGEVMIFGALAAVGLGLSLVHWPIGRGLVSFFTGTLLARSLLWLSGTNSFKRHSVKILGGTLAIGLVLLAGVWAIPHVLAAVGGVIPRAPGWTNSIIRNVVTLVVFPYLVFLVALTERIVPFRSEAMRHLGDCSYSIYLLHFPFQLLTVLVLGAMGVGESIFLAPAFLVIWTALLFSLGWLSYHYFERPMQRYIRASGRVAGARMAPVARESK